MRRNLTMDEASRGTYATTLFSMESERIIKNHDTRNPLFLVVNHLSPHSGNEDHPMQAPESEIEKFSYIKDPNRRTLAAMISLMDQSVGELVKNLEAKAMLDNTIILFSSDNGAPTLGQHGNFGSNFPFKGVSGTFQWLIGTLFRELLFFHSKKIGHLKGPCVCQPSFGVVSSEINTVCRISWSITLTGYQPWQKRLS
jgi:Sulfatase